METESNQKIKDKMAALSIHLSMIILKVNGLNSPIKRHGVTGWIKKQTQLHAASKRHSSALKTNTRLKVKG